MNKAQLVATKVATPAVSATMNQSQVIAAQVATILGATTLICAAPLVTYTFLGMGAAFFVGTIVLTGACICAGLLCFHFDTKGH